MLGLMQREPLLISSLIRHAARWHPEGEIVTRSVEGPITRSSYGAIHERAQRLANALRARGIRHGDRVGTLAWNTDRHMEIYFGVSGMGAVCHTINPRLFPEQITYIIGHGADRVLMFDATFLPLVEKLAPLLPTVEHFVLLSTSDRLPATTAIPNLTAYEDWLAAESADFDWPEFEETEASSLCYTSGTTGDPKGVLYTHRSTLLHTFAICLPDALSLSARDTMMPVVPMFHVNAWGLPYGAAMTGCKLVMPGAGLDGKNLYELIESEGVTTTAGVPTIWFALLQHAQKNKLRFSTLKRLIVGGSAAPESMIRTWQDDFGVEVLHAWGMTETSPVGTACSFKAHHARLPAEEKLALQSKQGRPLYGVDLRILGPDRQPVPHDGVQSGDLQVRGHWITSQYFGRPNEQSVHDGWFTTGDVATIDDDGYMQITDRSKDVIKSGGEWISSIALENVAVGHPAVAEAAAVAVHHPKWDERPLLVVVKKEGAALTREDMLAWFEGKVAKWWIPDEVVFVEQLPHTATGKLLKLQLRHEYHNYPLPTVERT